MLFPASWAALSRRLQLWGDSSRIKAAICAQPSLLGCHESAHLTTSQFLTALDIPLLGSNPLLKDTGPLMAISPCFHLLASYLIFPHCSFGHSKVSQLALNCHKHLLCAEL